MITPDLEWECDVLAACLRDVVFLGLAVPVLDRWDLSDEIHGWIWSVLSSTYREARELAPPRLFAARLEDVPEAKREAFQGVLLALARRRVETPRIALEEIRRFARMAAVRAGLFDGVDGLEKGSYEDVETSLRDSLARARAVGRISAPTSWGRGVDARIKRYGLTESRLAIQTPIRRITSAMSGGPGAGHFCLTISVTNVGKCLGNQGLILLADGRIERLADLPSQFVVWGLVEKEWAPCRAFKVETGRKMCRRVRTRRGRELIATPEHRCLTSVGWKTAGSLSVGDRLIVLETHRFPLTGSDHPPGATAEDLIVLIEDAGIHETCDLEVSGAENFIANGIVVHNSAWSIALGYTAATRGGANVLHLVTEETEEMVLARYDARVSGVERRRLIGTTSAEDMEALDTHLRPRAEFLGDRLLIQEIGEGASVDVVRGAVEYARSLDSTRPLFVIVDLIDDLRSGIRDNHVRDSAEVALGLKQLSMDRTLGSPTIWALAQARRLPPRKRIWSEDVSETYDRARKADFLMGLNEGDDDETSVKRHLEATIAKNRLGPDKRLVVHLLADLGTSQFEESASYEVTEE